MPKGEVPAKVTVDFSNVEERRESGGKKAHVPEGDYLLKVLGCEKRKKKDDETSSYLSWRTAIIKPEKYKTAGTVYHITSLKDEALWQLRNFLEDLGLDVPKSKISVPIAQIVAKQMVFGATLADDEYNGKVSSKIQATFKKSAYEETSEAVEADEDDDEEDEEEEEVKPAKAAKPAKKEDKKAKKDDDDEDEDLDELDVDDL